MAQGAGGAAALTPIGPRTATTSGGGEPAQPSAFSESFRMGLGPLVVTPTASGGSQGVLTGTPRPVAATAPIDPQRPRPDSESPDGGAVIVQHPAEPDQGQVAQVEDRTASPAQGQLALAQELEARLTLAGREHPEGLYRFAALITRWRARHATTAPTRSECERAAMTVRLWDYAQSETQRAGGEALPDTEEVTRARYASRVGGRKRYYLNQVLSTESRLQRAQQEAKVHRERAEEAQRLAAAVRAEAEAKMRAHAEHWQEQMRAHADVTRAQAEAEAAAARQQLEADRARAHTMLQEEKARNESLNMEALRLQQEQAAGARRERTSFTPGYQPGLGAELRPEVGAGLSGGGVDLRSVSLEAMEHNVSGSRAAQSAYADDEEESSLDSRSAAEVSITPSRYAFAKARDYSGRPGATR